MAGGLGMALVIGVVMPGLIAAAGLAEAAFGIDATLGATLVALAALAAWWAVTGR